MKITYLCSMKHEIIINGLEELDRAAEQFLSEIGDSTLIAFFCSYGFR